MTPATAFWALLGLATLPAALVRAMLALGWMP